MKKIAMTLGAAAVALTTVSATAAQAGVKVQVGGWHKPDWNVYYTAPYYYGYPKVSCFSKKKKVHTPNGWYWKKVRICKPFYPY